jgi:hypothetical protein
MVEDSPARNEQRPPPAVATPAPARLAKGWRESAEERKVIIPAHAVRFSARFKTRCSLPPAKA